MAASSHGAESWLAARAILESVHRRRRARCRRTAAAAVAVTLAVAVAAAVAVASVAMATPARQGAAVARWALAWSSAASSALPGIAQRRWSHHQGVGSSALLPGRRPTRNCWRARSRAVATAAAAGADAATVDPTAYRENRLAAIDDAAYPHEWSVDASVGDLVQRFQGLEAGSLQDGAEFRIAGRVKGKRASGAKLIFYDLSSNGSQIQIMCTAKSHEGGDFAEVHGSINRGDIIGVRGAIGKSKKGELSIFPKEVRLLAPCLHMLPKDYPDAPPRRSTTAPVKAA